MAERTLEKLWEDLYKTVLALPSPIEEGADLLAGIMVEEEWEDVLKAVMALHLPDKTEANLLTKIMIYVDKLKKEK